MSGNAVTNTDNSSKDQLRSLPSLKGPFRDVDMGDMPDTPRAAFRIWLEEAIAEGIKEPHAMTLSTVDEQGWPDARILILKNVDERGWHFAIKADSPKGRQIAGSGHVALTFYWPQLGRQIRLRGEAIELPSEECAEDFLGRPIGSKVSALASKQSQILDTPDEFKRRLGKAQAFLATNPEHIAPAWRVYAVAPSAVEFWQGATDRLHKRLRYVRSATGENWDKQSLWP